MHVGVLSDRYPPHNAAGAGRIAALLAEAYADADHEVTVITTTQKQSQAGWTNRNGVRIHRIHVKKHPRFRAYFGLYNPATVGPVGDILDSEGINVIHAHNVHEFLSYHSLKVADERSIPVVLTYHDAMSIEYGKLTHFIESVSKTGTGCPPASAYEVSPLRQLKKNRFRYFPLRNTLNRHYLQKYVKQAVAVSSELKRALTVNGVPCDTVIHNGIELSDFEDGSGAAFRERFDLGEAPVVLHGGRVGYWKGTEKLIQAFSQLTVPGSEPYLVITGSRSEAVGELKQSVPSVSGRILSTGWLDESELCDAYHAATVTASPSIYLDPFPTVNLESMAASTPPVTSCFGGARELVEDGQDGLVVNPLSPARLADHLSDLLVDDERLERFGENARTKIKDEYEISTVASRYLNLLSDPV